MEVIEQREDTNIVLLDEKNSPSWFSYPKSFLRLIEQDLIYFEPGYILEGKCLMEKFEGLKQRYPGRDLVPFARVGYSDDVACWEKGKGYKAKVKSQGGFD